MMVAVVRHWAFFPKIHTPAYQKVQRMKANVCLSFLWSNFGLKVSFRGMSKITLTHDILCSELSELEWLEICYVLWQLGTSSYSKRS